MLAPERGSTNAEYHGLLVPLRFQLSQAVNRPVGGMILSGLIIYSSTPLATHLQIFVDSPSAFD